MSGRLEICSVLGLVLFGVLFMCSALEQEAEISSDQCWNFGQPLFAPQEVMPVDMRTCCWYHRSTCCFGFISRLDKMLKEIYQLANEALVSERCYHHVADMYCNGCAPNTADFVEAREFETTKGPRTEIVVSICPSTCSLFYDACRDYAALKNVTNEIRFCETFTHHNVFGFDDDDDNDDDVVYRVSRTENSCFFGAGIASGGAIVGKEVGFCLPELRPDDVSEYDLNSGDPPEYVEYDSNRKAPAPRPDWPFPLPPNPVPGDPFAAIRDDASSNVIGLGLICVTLVLSTIVSLVLG